MTDQRFSAQHHSLEVGGPGGIRITSAAPRPVDSPAPLEPGGAMLRFAARNPRLLAAGFVVVGVAVLAGPLVLISTLGLPGWLSIGPVVLAILAFGCAVATARGSFRALSRAWERPELERQILDLAARFGGRLTVGITAQQLSISLTEAEDALMSLARAGHVDIDNDPESAAVIYVFRDLDSRLSSARRPLGLPDHQVRQ